MVLQRIGKVTFEIAQGRPNYILGQHVQFRYWNCDINSSISATVPVTAPHYSMNRKESARRRKTIKTLEDIRNTDKAFLTPDDISGVLGSNPQTIRVTARQRPDLIGYKFTFVGNRMKIPRIPFLRFLEAEKEEST